MSLASDCPGCIAGDHDRHDANWGIRPGLIGGSYCDCKGDCQERARDAADLLRDLAVRVAR